MCERRKYARILLRTKSEHKGDKDTEYYKKDQPLLLWMEKRLSGLFTNLLRLVIYTQFMAKFPDFRRPYIRHANSSLRFDSDDNPQRISSK